VGLTIPVLETWTWPWPIWTLHAVYLTSGLLIAVHYLPQIRRAWQFPSATLAAQSLLTWSVWTVCRGVACVYGVFVVHDLVFLVVVSADLFGRLAMVALILRAHAIVSEDRMNDHQLLGRSAGALRSESHGIEAHQRPRDPTQEATTGADHAQVYRDRAEPGAARKCASDRGRRGRCGIVRRPSLGPLEWTTASQAYRGN